MNIESRNSLGSLKKELEKSGNMSHHAGATWDEKLEKYYDAELGPDYCVPVKIDFETYNFFKYYWNSKSDLLYAVLSRRGDSREIYTVWASKEEVSRLKEIAEEIMLCPNSQSLYHVAENFLERLPKKVLVAIQKEERECSLKEPVPADFGNSITAHQAITTKYFGATDHRGARIRAKCSAGKMFIPWDYEIGTMENHAAAAIALLKKFGWLDTTVNNPTSNPPPVHIGKIGDECVVVVAIDSSRIY